MPQTQDLGYLENRVAENADSMLFARLAEGLLEVGRADEALDICQKGLAQHPHYATGHFVRAKILQAKGQLEEAEEAVNRGLELEPTSLWGLRLRAEILRSLHWLTNALAVYEKVLALDPTESRARLAVEDLRTQLEQQQGEAVVGAEEEVEVEEEESPAVGFEGEGVTEEETKLEEVTEVVELEAEEPEEATSEQFDQVIEEIFGDETAAAPDETELAQKLQEEVQEELEPPFPAEPEEEELELPVETEETQAPEESVSTEESRAAAREVEEIFGREGEEESVEFEEPEEGVAATPPETPIAEEARPTEETPPEEPEQRPSAAEPPRKIVTPTLGEIYAAQGQYAKAIGVFEILRQKEPDNPEWEKKIQMLKQKLAEAQDGE